MKKLIGSAGVLVFLAAYVWAASICADVVPKSALAQLVFFVFAGLLWGVPITPLILWMNREPGRKPPSSKATDLDARP